MFAVSDLHYLSYHAPYLRYCEFSEVEGYRAALCEALVPGGLLPSPSVLQGVEGVIVVFFWKRLR